MWDTNWLMVTQHRNASDMFGPSAALFPGYARSIGLDRTGDLLAVRGQRQISLLDPAKPSEPLWRLDHRGGAGAGVAVSPDGRWVATGSAVWEARTGFNHLNHTVMIDDEADRSP